MTLTFKTMELIGENEWKKESNTYNVRGVLLTGWLNVFGSKKRILVQTDYTKNSKGFKEKLALALQAFGIDAKLSDFDEVDHWNIFQNIDTVETWNVRGNKRIDLVYDRGQYGVDLDQFLIISIEKEI
jgi:hypothetical protein